MLGKSRKIRGINKWSNYYANIKRYYALESVVPNKIYKKEFKGKQEEETLSASGITKEVLNHAHTSNVNFEEGTFEIMNKTSAKFVGGKKTIEVEKNEYWTEKETMPLNEIEAIQSVEKIHENSVDVDKIKITQKDRKVVDKILELNENDKVRDLEYEKIKLALLKDALDSKDIID